jgi:hypothetical protein
MVGAFLHSMDISVSENFDEVNKEAMRAALLFLADNVSDEMVFAYEQFPVNTTTFFTRKEAISAAIHAAAGGDKQ